MKILNIYKKMSVQAKAASWFAICSLLQKGISFITVPIFTRLLTSEQYGTYTLYLSWLQILTIITSLNVHCGVFNNGMTKFDDDRDRYISSMQGVTLSLTAIVFLVFCINTKRWSDILGLSPAFVTLMFIELAVMPAYNFWSGRQRFEYKYRRLVAFVLTKSFLNPIIGMVLVWISEDKSMARIFSIVLIEGCFSGGLLIYQFRKGKVFFDKKYWKYAISIALPVLPHYLSGVILNQGDRIMINKMVGKSAVAFYGVAYSIGMLAQIFTGAIIDSFTPWFYQKIKSEEFDNIKDILNTILVVVMAIVLVLMLLSPEVVLIFGSAEYQSAALVIPPVAASVFFIFLYNIMVIPEFYFEKTQFLMISSFIAAALNILLNYIFIRLFGYVAAGYTTLACYVLYSFGHYYVSKRIVENKLNGVSLFDIKKIALFSIIVIVLGSTCHITFDYPVIRYLIIILSGVIIFLRRNQLFDLMKKIKEQ